MSRVNLTYIQTVCCIARTGTFTAAAQALHTTQSAVSARVRELENSLGIKLFSRYARTVELTIQGREFVNAAEPLLLQMDDLLNAFDDASGVTGRMRIGVGHMCMNWVPACVCELRRLMPKLYYDVETGMTAGLVHGLEVGRLDLAMVAGPVDGSKLHMESLGNEQMGWFVSPEALGDDAEALRDPAALFARLPIWSIPRDSFYFRDATAVLLRRGYPVRHFNSCVNIVATQDLVLGGAGIGLLPMAMANRHVRTGALVQVLPGEPLPPIELFMACRREHYHSTLRQVMQVAASVSRRRRERDMGLR